MPSWNIHTAIVEDLLHRHEAAELGIADENAFLFGNYVPDVYVGFMVPDASMRIDYCITHMAMVNLIPIPDADLFWDNYIARRCPKDEAGRSLALGAWAHLVADRFYNGRFRTFSKAHSLPKGEMLRTGKQGDFDKFGRSLNLTSRVEVTQELLDAAWSFLPYRILPDDIRRSVEVACAIVDESGAKPPASEDYQMLSEEWMQGVLDDCVDYLAVWLTTWQQLAAEGACFMAADIRATASLPAAVSDAAE